MDKCNSTMAQQIAELASAFEQRRTGHVPKSVTVVLSDRTLVITLYEALSPAERALANSRWVCRESVNGLARFRPKAYSLRRISFDVSGLHYAVLTLR